MFSFWIYNLYSLLTLFDVLLGAVQMAPEQVAVSSSSNCKAATTGTTAARRSSGCCCVLGGRPGWPGALGVHGVAWTRLQAAGHPCIYICTRPRELGRTREWWLRQRIETGVRGTWRRSSRGDRAQ